MESVSVLHQIGRMSLKNTQAATNINLIFTLQLKIFIEVN